MKVDYPSNAISSRSEKLPSCRDFLSHKAEIISVLRSTGRPGIEAVIRFLESSDFFTAPCHTHHTYSGGLAEHSLETYHIALNAHPELPKDSIAICCLLHDVCTAKGSGTDWFHGHGIRSKGILQSHCHLAMTSEEQDAIRFHMHRHCPAYQDSALARAVFHADKDSAHAWHTGRE